jgi:hypothetical protein
VGGEVISNTATTITIRHTWSGTTPIAGATYSIYQNMSKGTVSSASGTTLNDTNTYNGSARNWPASANLSVRITGGTGVGQVRRITLSTATQLNISPAWDTTPDATSTYQIELRFYDNDHITGNISNYFCPITKDSGRVRVYVDGNYAISLNTESPLTFNSSYAERISFEPNLRAVQGGLNFWSGITANYGNAPQWGGMTLIGVEIKDTNTTFALNSKESIEQLVCNTFIMENSFRPPLPSATLSCSVDKKISKLLAWKGPYAAHPGFPGVTSATKWEYETCWFEDGTYGFLEWKINGPDKQLIRNSVVERCTHTASSGISMSAGKQAAVIDCYVNMNIGGNALVGSVSTTHAGEYAIRNNVGVFNSANSSGGVGTLGAFYSAFNDYGGVVRTNAVRAIVGTANTNYTTARSDWDRMAGNMNAAIENVDVSLGTSSSASPAQWNFLTSGRHNPLTSVNKPYIADNITTSGITEKSVTIAFDCKNGAVAGVGSTTLSGTASSGGSTIPVNELMGFFAGDIIEIAYGNANYERHEIASSAGTGFASASGNLTIVGTLANTHNAGVSIKRVQRHKALPFVLYGEASGVYEFASAIPPRTQWPLIFTELDQVYNGVTYSFKQTGHSVILDNLEPAKTFYYRAGFVTPQGIIGVSPEYTFTTTTYTNADYPPVSTVLDTETFANGLYTGTYKATIDATTKIGTAYGPASSLTGTYDGAERYTDVPQSLVVGGVGYRYNTTGSDNRTGTLDIAEQVWNAPLSSHTTPGTFGTFVKKLLTVAKFLGLK